MRQEQERIFEKTGKLVPYPALQNEPELDQFAALYISEFFSLSAGRTSNGFGLNPLQYSEIRAFLLLGMSIAPDEPDEYAEVMRLIDNKYLKLHSEKEERKSKEKDNSMSGKAPKKPARR